MTNIDKRLKELNIILENPSSPAANYIPYSIVGNLVFISGQLPFKKGSIPITGIVGEDVSIDNAIEMAELCALALISQLKEACNGNLDNVKKVVKLGGFVASSKDFGDQPKVINGASDMMVKIFGDQGKHSRFAIGVASLPRNAPVEVEGIFEIKN
tara:strand:+ start:618 stop:1085 length:468 start_codon:yes stop_codon:yes gene_type:complete